MPRRTRALFPTTARRATDLGARLRLARLRRGISALEMAERVGVSRPTFHKLEVGDVSVSLAVLARVLEVLGLDPDLDQIGADDTVGKQLSDARLTTPHRPPERSLADEL